MKIEFIAPRVGLRMCRTAAGGDDSKRVTFFTPWSWQWDPDLSSNWIPFSGRSNLSLCAPFCSIIAPRHLNPPPLIVFYSFLILFLVDWFFLFLFLLLLSVKAKTHQELRFLSARGPASVCFFVFLFSSLHRTQYVNMHFATCCFFARLQRAGGSERSRGALMFKGTRPGLRWRPPWLRRHDRNTKKLLDLFAYAASKHSPCSSLTEEQGIWTNHPGRVLSDYIFIRCNVRRVKRSSELMDDLIMGDWLYWFGWPYPHCLSGPLELRADTIPHRLKPPYSRNSSFRLH